VEPTRYRGLCVVNMTTEKPAPNCGGAENARNVSKCYEKQIFLQSEKGMTGHILILYNIAIYKGSKESFCKSNLKITHAYLI